MFAKCFDEWFVWTLVMDVTIVKWFVWKVVMDVTTVNLKVKMNFKGKSWQGWMEGLAGAV